jgi:hypothetical protein
MKALGGLGVIPVPNPPAQFIAFWQLCVKRGLARMGIDTPHEYHELVITRLPLAPGRRRLTASGAFG